MGTMAAPERTPMEQLRAAQPRLHRAYVIFRGVFLGLAVLFALAATVEPLWLLMVALCLGEVGAVQFSAWFWVLTTTPRERDRMERTVQEREAARRTSERGA
jgi:hypothetical protein